MSSPSLYEAAVVSKWRLTGDKCDIRVLRDAYFEIFFQKHRNNRRYNVKNVIEDLRRKKDDVWSSNWNARDRYSREYYALTRFDNDEEQLRYYMKECFINNGSTGNLYKILRKYGRKVPMSPGVWQFDPEYAESKVNIYFQTMTTMVLKHVEEHFNKDKRVANVWKFSYDEPHAYYYNMNLYCYFSTPFMRIPFNITLRKQSIGVWSRLVNGGETEIMFHDNYHGDFSGITDFLHTIQDTFINEEENN
jgi:hypothetical protein